MNGQSSSDQPLQRAIRELRLEIELLVSELAHLQETSPASEEAECRQRLEGGLEELRSKAAALEGRVVSFMEGLPELPGAVVEQLEGQLREQTRVLISRGYLEVLNRCVRFRGKLASATSGAAAGPEGGGQGEGDGEDERRRGRKDGVEGNEGQVAYRALFEEFLLLLETQLKVSGSLKLSGLLEGELVEMARALKRCLAEQVSDALKRAGWGRVVSYQDMLEHPAELRLLRAASNLLIELQIVTQPCSWYPRVNERPPRPASQIFERGGCGTIMTGGSRLGGLWVVDLLVVPIRKRMRYHFSGLRPTNDVQKAHWVFSWLSKLVKSSEDFFAHPSLFQPLRSFGLMGIVDPFREFVAQLVLLLAEKLLADRPLLCSGSDDALLRLWIDQAHAFDRDLLLHHGYPSSSLAGSLRDGPSLAYPVVMATFALDPAYLQAWLDIENSQARTLYQRAFDSPDAWRPLPDSPCGFPLPCAADVVELISHTTERYRQLPLIDCRLVFLENVQVPLLLRFRRDVKLIADQLRPDIRSSSRSSSSSSSSSFSFGEPSAVRVSCALINSIHHVLTRTREILWLDHLFEIPPEALRTTLAALSATLTDFRLLLGRLLLRDPSDLLTFRTHLSAAQACLHPGQYALLHAELADTSLPPSTQPNIHLMLAAFLPSREP